eukprot:1118098-Pelagomonas_calceolata.AAC.1
MRARIAGLDARSITYQGLFFASVTSARAQFHASSSLRVKPDCPVLIESINADYASVDHKRQMKGFLENKASSGAPQEESPSETLGQIQAQQVALLMGWISTFSTDSSSSYVTILVIKAGT